MFLSDSKKLTTDDNEQVRGIGVTIEEACEGLANDDIIVEGLINKEWRYPTRKRQSLGEWWKNHIWPQHGEDRANVAILECLLSWIEAIRHNIWTLMGNVKTSLHKVEKLRNSIVLQVFDYSQSGSVEGRALDCS